jgi:SPP1 gp7 family putative phage head morphogenesis protein
VIPTGRDLAAVLYQFMRQVGLQWQPGQDLSRYIEALKTTVRPFLWRYFLLSAERTTRAIVAAARLRKDARPIRVKEPPQVVGIFNLLLPQVQTSIDHMIYHFAASTLATAQVNATQAYALTRAQLAEGVEHGEGMRQLRNRIQEIFEDRMRALRIAQTEVTRAMHSGQVEAARQSGIVAEMEWLASADSCELCEQLDGERRKIGQAFYIDPRGGPYARVEHPPAHPNCRCVLQEILQ